MSTPKRIHLIRHGQTDWNADGRWQGHIDVPLGELGHQQARALAEQLRDTPIEAVFASDLGRASETARYLANVLNVPLSFDPRWREINLGVLQGLTHTEIISRYPQHDEGMRTDYMGYIVTDGESRRAMQDRAFAVFLELMQNEYQEMAVVSHGGTIRLLLMRLFENPPQLQSISIKNTSHTIIEVDGDTYTLVQLASIDHLKRLDGKDAGAP